MLDRSDLGYTVHYYCADWCKFTVHCLCITRATVVPNLCHCAIFRAVVKCAFVPCTLTTCATNYASAGIRSNTCSIISTFLEIY